MTTPSCARPSLMHVTWSTKGVGRLTYRDAGRATFWQLRRSGGGSRMGRVLVVEDDDRIAQLVARALRDDGFTVDRAATGPDGVAAAADHEFDVVVLDLMLPGLDGTEVLARLVEA